MSFTSSVIFPLVKGVFTRKRDTSDQYTMQMFDSFHREGENAEDRFVHYSRAIYAGERDLDIYLPPKGTPQRGAIIYSSGVGFIVDSAVGYIEDGGERITADDIGQLTGTIGYEIVCDISKRVPRLYK